MLVAIVVNSALNAAMLQALVLRISLHLRISTVITTEWTYVLARVVLP